MALWRPFFIRKSVVIRILKQLLRVLHRGALHRGADIELGGDHDAFRIRGERHGVQLTQQVGASESMLIE